MEQAEKRLTANSKLSDDELNSKLKRECAQAHTRGGSVRGPSGNRLHGAAWRGPAWDRWRRFGGGGFSPLLANCSTGNIGSLCEQQPLKALRAPGGPIPQYIFIFYPLLALTV
jgi:hypothetical protein